MPRLFLLCALLILGLVARSPAQADAVPGRWTAERAEQWAQQHPWTAGGNFLPSSAINQLEMWQADTFDAATIDRDLGYAEGLGFRSMRVFLHDLAWRQDPEGFFQRMEQYLAMADRHHLTTLFVLFDSCWNPMPHTGVQPAPRPFVHNSGWVQSPGALILADPNASRQLEGYVKSVLQHFRNDPRVIGWDLYNEPDNSNASSYGKQEIPDKVMRSLVLLKQTFVWARDVAPSQPLTSGVWRGDWDLHGSPSAATTIQLENSDLISFHCYDPIDGMKARVETLEKLGRPLLCTEYMARPRGSRFETILPYLKEQGIPAYNWGFVAGKSQTNFPWDSWQRTYTGEPPEWFHDVVHADGTPYRASEARFLRALLGVPAP